MLHELAVVLIVGISMVVTVSLDFCFWLAVLDLCDNLGLIDSGLLALDGRELPLKEVANVGQGPTSRGGT